MEKHLVEDDRYWRRVEQSMGSRPNDGNDCPNDVELFIAATSQVMGGLPRDLVAHLERCPICRRTIELASRPIGELNFADRALPDRSDSKAKRFADCLMNSMSVIVPVIKRFAQGSIHCMVGESVLVVFLAPNDRRSGWGSLCRVQSGSSCVEVNTTIVSRRSLLQFRPGDSINIQVSTDHGSDTVSFDWDGWGDSIGFVAVAVFPANIEDADEILQSLEELRKLPPRETSVDSSVPSSPGPPPILCPISINDLRGNGVAATRAFEGLQQFFEMYLKPKLMTWKRIQLASHSLDLPIELALKETLVQVYRARHEIPDEPEFWLLGKAAENLLRILSKLFVGDQVLEVVDSEQDPRAESAALVRRIRKEGWDASKCFTRGNHQSVSRS